MDTTTEQQSTFDGLIGEIQKINCSEWERQLLNLSFLDLEAILSDEQSYSRDVTCSPSSSVSSRSPTRSEVSLTPSPNAKKCFSSNASPESILDQAIEKELGFLKSYQSDSSSPDKVEESACKDDSSGQISPRCQEPYMEMIAKAFMCSPDKKLLLSNIYSYIQINYADFTSSKMSWRNSVRHNLSVNECFVKSGRSPSGRGYFWSIHPACIKNFKQGNYQRRAALTEVTKHNSLTFNKGRQSRKVSPYFRPEDNSHNFQRYSHKNYVQHRIVNAPQYSQKPNITFKQNYDHNSTQNTYAPYQQHNFIVEQQQPIVAANSQYNPYSYYETHQPSYNCYPTQNNSHLLQQTTRNYACYTSV